MDFSSNKMSKDVSREKYEKSKELAKAWKKTAETYKETINSLREELDRLETVETLYDTNLKKTKLLVKENRDLACKVKIYEDEKKEQILLERITERLRNNHKS